MDLIRRKDEVRYKISNADLQNKRTCNTSGTEKQNSVSPILCLRLSFFLEQYVTFRCLILSPATKGDYLDLQPSATERVFLSVGSIYYQPRCHCTDKS